MEIPFKKMHGAGNDFIIIKYEDFPNEEVFSQFALRSCHRNFGVGADGMMVVGKSSIADFKMYYYNSDGSLAKMCGNGIRCFAKFVYDEGLTDKEEYTIETLAGVHTVKLVIQGGKTKAVSVNMGKIAFDPKQIPVKWNEKEFIKQIIEIEGKKIEISSVLMGVPHTIIFTDHLDLDFVKKFGPVIEMHPLFPEKTNVNFAKILDRQHVEVRTWERGAGYTLACGTGVTSVCGLANYLDYVGDSVTVDTEGGRLHVFIEKDLNIYMEGPAETICSGIYFMEG